MGLFVSREYIMNKIKEKAFGNNNIKISEDTMLRGIRVAKAFKINDESLTFHMGSNKYSLTDRVFNRVMKEIMDEAHGFLESDDTKTYIEYLV